MILKNILFWELNIMKKNIKTLSILSLVSTMLLGAIVTTIPMTVKADKLQSEDIYGHEEIINSQKVWAMNHDDLMHQFGLDKNQIMVHMDHDGKVTTNESLTYTKVTSANTNTSTTN